MSDEHKVKNEGAPRPGSRGGTWNVTWECTCGKKFTGHSGGSPRNRERILSLARRRAEALFREHLPIR